MFESSPPFRAVDASLPSADRPVTAVLGPTNTGKTHYAIERMLAYKSGMIGFPLRLLAREIYDKLVKRRPTQEIALVTGEEKIVPKKPRYWICTVEAMPLSEPVEFLAIDEIQLAANPERGRTFSSRLLNARGRAETLFLGSDTMAPILRQLFPKISFLGRERFSTLAFTGSKKVTRLPRRTAIVAFSSDTVYAIAELVRRQRGGAAVVLGALSPRTRNAQAALYQDGEVDYLIATDAIGMGLNMDIDHVAFAGRRKFDGRHMRDLTAAEAAQIAGRAGRHMRDGTFGITGDCRPFDEAMIEAIEEHRFEAVRGLFWRSENLDFASIPALLNSLETKPPRAEFIRARPDDDERAFAFLVRDPDIREMAGGGAALALLWEVCQLPDFRKVTVDQHGRLIGEIYTELIRHERLAEDWFAPRIAPLQQTTGDIDTLSSRIAHIRSFTYLAHRVSWVDKATYWQERTRAIEDRLSDALHERLTQRFVDRRTAVLLKKLKSDEPLLAGVTDDGEVIVEGQFVGRLLGFEFIIDPRATGPDAKPVRAAAEKALAPVLAARASALANAKPEDLSIDHDGTIWWRQSGVATLEKGPAPLRPKLVIRNIGSLTPVLRGRIEDRLTDYMAARIEGLLGPLIATQQLIDATGEKALDGTTRGVAYRLVENFGAASRHLFGDDLKQLAQTERAKLRNAGMRFGEYTLFMPALLKPAPASLLTLLWALWHDRDPSALTPIKAGLVSTAVEENVPHAFYYASGYRPSGNRAVRIDMLERLAGDIRRAREAAGRDGFEATPQMMSLVGCSGEDFEAILTSLGFRKNTVRKSFPPKPIVRKRRVEIGPDIAAADDNQNGAHQPPEAAPSVVTENARLDAGPDGLSSSTAEEGSEQARPPMDGATPQPADQIVGDGVAALDIGPETRPTGEPRVGEGTPAAQTPSSQVQASAGADIPDTPSGVPETVPPVPTEIEETINPAGPPHERDIILWRFQMRRSDNQRDRGAHHHRNGSQTAEGRPGSKADGRPQHNRKPKGGDKFASAAQGERQPGKDPRRKGPQKHGKGDPKKIVNPHMNKPRHLKEADPDSPFAVLAALKHGGEKND